MAILFLIIDGLYDTGNETPLLKAKTPNMDEILNKSDSFLSYPLDPGKVPGSEDAHLELFGYYEYFYGRGLYEALGYLKDVNPDYTYFRVNFATVDENLRIVDRRAGRSDYLLNEITEKINEIDERFEVIHTLEHRGILIYKGECPLNIGNDPKKEGVKPLKTILEIDNWLKKVHNLLKKCKENKLRIKKGLLPANYLLIRGAGRLIKIPPKFEEKYGLKSCCIAGGPLYKGIARFCGMDIINVPGDTGTVKTNLRNKARYCIKMKNKYDFIFCHIKGTDTLSHDKKRYEKQKFIEKIDSEFVSLIKDEFEIIVLGADHTTSSITGKHSWHPCIFLIKHENARPFKNQKFSEFIRTSCGTIRHRDLVNILLSILN